MQGLEPSKGCKGLQRSVPYALDRQRCEVLQSSERRQLHVWQRTQGQPLQRRASADHAVNCSCIQRCYWVRCICKVLWHVLCIRFLTMAIHPGYVQSGPGQNPKRGGRGVTYN